MTTIDLPGILTRADVDVDPVAGWPSRGISGAFAPDGVFWHHTGGVGAGQLRYIVDHTLANVFLDRAGVWHICSGNRVAHGGVGIADVYARRDRGLAPLGDAKDAYPGVWEGRDNDKSSANTRNLGIEIEHIGDPRVPYPEEQLRSLLAGTVAIFDALGWQWYALIAHKEATKRKPDPTALAMPLWRGALRLKLEKATPTPPDPVDEAVTGGVTFEEDNVRGTLLTCRQKGYGLYEGVWDPGFGRDPVCPQATFQGPAPGRHVGGSSKDSPDDWWPHLFGAEPPRCNVHGGKVVVTFRIVRPSPGAPDKPQPSAVSVYVSAA